MGSYSYPEFSLEYQTLFTNAMSITFHLNLVFGNLDWKTNFEKAYCQSLNSMMTEQLLQFSTHVSVDLLIELVFWIVDVIDKFQTITPTALEISTNVNENLLLNHIGKGFIFP